MIKIKKLSKQSTNDELKQDEILNSETVKKTKNKKTTKSQNVIKIIFDYNKTNTTIEF